MRFGFRHAIVSGAALVVVALGASGAGAATNDVATLVNPAVVDVNTVLGLQPGARAAGTGVVLTSSGVVLTNNHVIRGATKVSVTDVGNGKTYSASVVGYDVSEDIAVLQLKGASGLATVTTETAGVKVGEAITAIGNAGGVAGTPAAAAGVVTGLEKSITATDDDGTFERLVHLIETDAQLEPGDSGGPLVNAAGHVVGIDTAAEGGFSFQDPSGTTHGYAIPIARALALAKAIQAGHSSATTHIGATPLLGVGVSTATTDSYGYGGYGGYYDTNPGTGAVISNVLTGSPAAKIGLSAGDVITMVAGKKITTPTSLTTALLRFSPNASVTVTWVDGTGVTQHASARLIAGPSQ